MEFAYCEGMSNAQPSMKNFNIKETTAVKKYDVLTLDSKGYAVKANTGDHCIGLAAEDHPANVQSNIMPAKNTIKVIDSPNAIYRASAMTVKFSQEHSTNTRLFSPEYTGGNCFTNFTLVLISKAPGSQNTDKIGSLRKSYGITQEYNEEDSSVTYYFTVESGGIPHNDDVYALLPDIGSTYITTGSGNNDFSLITDTGIFRCIGQDLSANNSKGLPSCFLKLINHTTNKVNE